MTLSTISILQQMDDEFHQQNLAVYLERKKKKEFYAENEPSLESRLASLEFEVQRLQKKIECPAE